MTVTELKPESVWFAFVDLGVSNLTEELKLHLQNFSAFTLSNSFKKQFYGLINEMEAFQGNWITGNQELNCYTQLQSLYKRTKKVSYI